MITILTLLVTASAIWFMYQYGKTKEEREQMKKRETELTDKFAQVSNRLHRLSSTVEYYWDIHSSSNESKDMFYDIQNQTLEMIKLLDIAVSKQNMFKRKRK